MRRRIGSVREMWRLNKTLLDHIIGVDEAGELWNLSPDHVKRLCREGKLLCKKIGKTWVLLRDQPNPAKYVKGAE